MNCNTALALILYREMSGPKSFLTAREKQMIYEVFGNRPNAERIARETGLKDNHERWLAGIADEQRRTQNWA